MAAARDFAKLEPLDRMFNGENRKIALEDRAVVESSHPREVPEAREERSVRTDAPALYFRRRYFAELRGSSSPLGDGSVTVNRLTRLPVLSPPPAEPARTGS